MFVVSLSLSFLLLQGVGDPFIDELGHPLVSLYNVPAPPHGSDPQLSRSPGVCGGRRRAAWRAEPASALGCASPVCSLWFSWAPAPSTPPLGSKVGLGEAEDQPGLWDQSVQGCFSCTHASSVLTLVLRWGGRAGTRSEAGIRLGRGAPGSGKCWTPLRNSSGGGNGSQRFLLTPEASGLPWRDLGAWQTWHPRLCLRAGARLPGPQCPHL